MQDPIEVALGELAVLGHQHLLDVPWTVEDDDAAAAEPELEAVAIRLRAVREKAELIAAEVGHVAQQDVSGWSRQSRGVRTRHGRHSSQHGGCRGEIDQSASTPPPRPADLRPIRLV